jgi:diadenylate cyclase
MTSDARYRDLFGMRHKAAIGISEVSDAVVVIVSEETGQISIAYDGELESNIPRSSFSTRFAEYLRR